MTDKATSESVKKIEEMMSQFMSHMDKRMSDMEQKVEASQRKTRTNDDEYESNSSAGSHKRGSFSNSNSSLASIKLKIPTFSGSDPDDFLDWVDKVDSIYAIHDYSEEKKIKLAVVEFTGYARSWWNKILAERRRNHEAFIPTWLEMKSMLRKRFVPQSTTER